jgi:hypothetical protein
MNYTDFKDSIRNALKSIVEKKVYKELIRDFTLLVYFETLVNIS